jgi:predicted nucleotidyltransferase
MIGADVTLPEITAIVADWADRYPWVKCVVLFGSRVRGDHRPDSDLDLWTWTEFEDEQPEWLDDYWSGIPALQERLGMVVHPCNASDLDLEPQFHAGQVIHRDRKVRCIVIPRSPYRSD